MDRYEGARHGRPVIVVGLSLLRISRIGRRTVEVIADVRFRDSARGSIQRQSVFVSDTLPPASPGRARLRQRLLERIFLELDKTRAAEDLRIGRLRDRS